MRATNSITVICEDSTHNGKRTVVTRFFRPASGDDRSWQETPGRSARLRRTGEPTRIVGLLVPPKPDKPEAFQSLHADDSPAGIGGAILGGRNRYRLRCELCGITVPGRQEKLFPLFDKLSAAGVSSISLVALAARLR